ncbi:hypothetical protein DASC09_039460 [Saccharomycopsis crataegensis]|uniref:PCI domain-containing protein n=1 Tax=Saccharomycopsis crataegensis TaxID=43959 RepID=A0AAV5QPY0_9ASCO|nr:hypothetical protein DASC09_039460 [Saccharomycopsis crataegensis]
MQSEIDALLSSPFIWNYGTILNNAAASKHFTGQEMKLLEVFSYGAYNDYVNNHPSLPQLSPSATLKLRELTLLKCIKKHFTTYSNRISYSILLDAIGLPSDEVVLLENSLKHLIYQRLIQGKLDEVSQCLKVTEMNFMEDIHSGEVDLQVLNPKEVKNVCYLLSALEEFKIKVTKHASQVLEIREGVDNLEINDEPLSESNAEQTPVERTSKKRKQGE